ncbi:Putative Histidine triad-like protein [[Torrubiella] hemipterigena]|uniref:Putative Histidine triad-like protein n=1 Tax=[Torrubiella] hemipterigena TaxID=1531966 RepID=A0A0A1TPM3_9HYPO|nr:Putative Histidine triad-like protein [[Torrubiella] hemipterigena]
MFDPTKPPEQGENCPFCTIAAVHSVYDPASPPATIDSELTTPSSFLVLSTPTIMAFLDILPLSRGHVLVCPRTHRPKLTDTTPQEAAALGEQVRVLSEAVARATGVHDWNIVQNNGAAAAQVVPHVHYHLIPRPEIRASGRFRESFTMFGRGQREELDDEEAAKLAAEIRKHIADVIREDRGEVVIKSKL